VNEAPHFAVLACALQENVRSQHVVLRKQDRGRERVIDVRARRKVEHCIDALLLEHVEHQVMRADIAANKLEVWSVCHLREVAQRRAVVELVQYRHAVMGISTHELFDYVRGNKAGTASHKDIPRHEAQTVAVDDPRVRVPVGLSTGYRLGTVRKRRALRGHLSRQRAPFDSDTHNHTHRLLPRSACTDGKRHDRGARFCFNRIHL